MRNGPYKFTIERSCRSAVGEGAAENARPENDGMENDGQIPKELQDLENAGLENDGQHFSNLRPKIRGLGNA